MAEKRTSHENIRLRRENTTAVATALVAADRKAKDEKTARLRAAREATETVPTGSKSKAPPG